MSSWLPFLALAFVSCASGSSGTHPIPEPKLAIAGSGTERGVACAERRAYDEERGCVRPLWGVPVRVAHRSEMSPAFQLIGAAYALDGELMFDANDTNLLNRRGFAAFTTSVRSGHHELSVVLVYRGHGSGVFAYLSKYTFRATAKHAFEAKGSRGVTLTAVAYERGGVTAPLEKRPAVRFDGE